MVDKQKTGIVFLQAADNNQKDLDFKTLTSYLNSMHSLKVFTLQEKGGVSAEKWSEEIRQHKLTSLVIAGTRPGIHKSAFTRAMQLAGGDPGNVKLAFLRGNGMDPERNLVLNKSILLSSINDVNIDEIIQAKDYDINDTTLVIGGGIGGIQASLEIAGGNKKVYLLEKSSTIGGHMAMFDKTFPTLDCAACILTPKMVEVGQHPNIEMLTYSELLGVEGTPGNYTVKILKKARRVNLALCIGCGTCAEKCPSKAPSEFDAYTTLRKAIYIAFPQAVPNKYVIDADNCTYVKNGKCGVCVKFCPVDGCINLDEKDETIELNVGNIIVATGFKPFDPTVMEQYGYGKFPNVITSLELERLINASGPTGGKITFRTRDKKGNWIFDPATSDNLPRSFAIIHCIGSRDNNHHKYCSRVCCMYSLKLAHLLKEKVPDAPVYEYFIDMRAFGKGYEEFYERIKSEGVLIIRGRTARIVEKDGKLVLRTEDILGDRLVETSVDMVVLSVGIEPREDAGSLASMLKVETDEYGWFRETGGNMDPVSTLRAGIYLAGVCQGPKDIPDTVAHASAAAANVLKSIIRGRSPGGLYDFDIHETETRITELILKDR
ncbi:MAG TPA: CoB--CoM heterodisulfide reductase iron-sulfur subunit A family protein [Bacteroidales bacterium]|nr:CoB--CoM heterodisulfide reductase iron-sulfur subunit A family protein [Bacteroidales bacterium]